MREALVLVLLAAEVQDHLTQPEQIEVVDQESRVEHGQDTHDEEPPHRHA